MQISFPSPPSFDTPTWNVVPDPDEPLTESDVAIVAGHDETLARFTRELSES